MPADPDSLDADLRAAHDGDDWAHLSALNRAAAAQGASDAEERFFLTHAWVFALVEGNAAAVADLETRLKALGGL